MNKNLIYINLDNIIINNYLNNKKLELKNQVKKQLFDIISKTITKIKFKKQKIKIFPIIINKIFIIILKLKSLYKIILEKNIVVIIDLLLLIKWKENKIMLIK